MKKEKEGEKYWMYPQINVTAISCLWKSPSHKPVFMIQQSGSLWFAILVLSAVKENLDQSETLL